MFDDESYGTVDEDEKTYDQIESRGIAPIVIPPIDFMNKYLEKNIHAKYMVLVLEFAHPKYLDLYTPTIMSLLTLLMQVDKITSHN